MVSVAIAAEGLERMRRELVDDVERVGFFLAHVDRNRRTFELGEWRLIPPAGFTVQTDFHVALTDEMKVEIIQWAWSTNHSLVEVHSHLDSDTAEFSPSDLSGFEDWVPHLRWRLGGRPYAAMVWDESSFDGLAWIDPDDGPEQVEAIVVPGLAPIQATGRTLRRRLRMRHG